jgi:hypothetical protein
VGHRRLELLESFYRKAKEGGAQAPRQLDRRRDLGIDEFRERYQKAGIPVVLEGAAREWPCCRKWTLPKIAEECGNDLLPIDHAFRKLSPVLRAIHEGRKTYLRFYSLVQRHPEYLKDLDLPWLLSRRNPERSIDQGFQTFIGNTQSPPTALHNANDGNLFVQVTGVKHWRLYDSKDTFAIDPGPVQGEYRTQRHDRPAFDPFAPDYERFPIFKYIGGYETTLEPGDVLWNPPYVWHAVRNLTNPTIGIGYRWVTPSHCFSLAPLLATLDCLATKPPIWESIKLADRDFSMVFLEQFPQLKKHPGYPQYVAQVEGSYSEYRAAMDHAAARSQELRRAGGPGKGA